MTDKQFRFARTSQCYCLGQRENACSKANCTQIIQYRAEDVIIRHLPVTQGVYLLFDGQRLLYVGEAKNLRLRIKKHLDHSDNRELARWLWENGPEELRLEIQILEPHTPTKTRKALEAELIRSRDPVFNVK